MAATGRLRFRCTIPRRGGTQNWSTSYHLDTAPPDLTTFEDLVDALTSSGSWFFQSQFWSDIAVVGADWYPPGVDVATWSKSLSLTGGLTTTNTGLTSSDTVALVRWSTTARSAKNHPVYLFNYLHGARWKTGTAEDLLDSDQKDAVNGFSARLVTGVTANGVTFHRAGPNGAVAQSAVCDLYLRHRDFPT